MAIGRITGPMLFSNLERQGVDLAIDGNLIYAQVTNRYVGIGTASPAYPLDVPGNVRLANLTILNNTITSNTGKINLGSNSNVTITGGSLNYVLSTDGAGNLTWSNIATVITAGSVTGNTISLGANTVGAFVSNAVTLTTSTTVTDGIAQLNQILGKLVPPSPPNFPNAVTLTVGTSYPGLMTNFAQTDNSGWGNLSVAAGTLVSAIRTATFTTSSITNVGPGSSGTVTSYVNGLANGNVTLTGSNSNTTNGNLYVYNVEDYHNIVSSVTAGFWTVFSTYATANAGVPAGWNRVYIYDSGTNTQTNNATWYYDNSSPGTPTFSATSMVLSSNVVSYSSTIPHLTSSSGFTLKGNVTNLSGDLYYNGWSTSGSNFFYSTASGGALATPAQQTVASTGLTLPLARNTTATAVFTTTANVVSGFGSSLSAAGPILQVNNSYLTGMQTFQQGNIILYKTGTSNQIEETSIPVSTNLGGGFSSNGYRITGLGNADTPTYNGSETAFNSQTSTLQTYDATVVGAVLKNDKTNYSTGYLPVGPNLSGQANTQYFTFKFQRTTVSQFRVIYTGNIAGLYVSLPGSTIDSTSGLNGWLDASIAYGGSGIPGSVTGAGGNGSNGCSSGGVAPINTNISANVLVTFGTVSSSSALNNEIYVRIKLTTGQTVTSLGIYNSNGT